MAFKAAAWAAGGAQPGAHSRAECKEPGNLAVGGSNQEMSIDFGFCASLVLGNLVFSDVNNNGVVNAGEGGVEGAQIELFRSTNTTVNDADDVKVGTTFTTGADGLYSFAGLSAGRYYIKLTPPITHPRRSSTSSNARTTASIMTTTASLRPPPPVRRSTLQ
jgi:hypothetical protein